MSVAASRRAQIRASQNGGDIEQLCHAVADHHTFAEVDIAPDDALVADDDVFSDLRVVPDRGPLPDAGRRRYFCALTILGRPMLSMIARRSDQCRR